MARNNRKKERKKKHYLSILFVDILFLVAFAKRKRRYFTRLYKAERHTKVFSPESTTSYIMASCRLHRDYYRLTFLHKTKNYFIIYHSHFFTKRICCYFFP